MRALAVLAAVLALVAAVALPAAADAPLRPPTLIRLSDAGPAFLDYDGGPDLSAGSRDWAVSMIFAGHASVTKVKTALRTIGFTHRGHTRYLAYRTADGTLRFDSDRGLKTACGPDGTDVHVRLYAPTATDRFADPQYGSVVVGTTHLDRADGCSTPPQLYGFSEAAEGRLADVIARRLGWLVQPNHLALGNPEPYRRDMTDGAHVWWNDGRATLVMVP